MNEMHRVTKVNGFYTIITYGSPDMRLSVFLDSLPRDTYELRVKEIPLSFMANLINSLRSKSKNKSLTDALKDKQLLVSSVMEGNYSTNKFFIDRIKF